MESIRYNRFLVELRTRVRNSPKQWAEVSIQIKEKKVAPGGNKPVTIKYILDKEKYSEITLWYDPEVREEEIYNDRLMQLVKDASPYTVGLKGEDIVVTKTLRDKLQL